MVTQVRMTPGIAPGAQGCMIYHRKEMVRVSKCGEGRGMVGVASGWCGGVV